MAFLYESMNELKKYYIKHHSHSIHWIEFVNAEWINQSQRNINFISTLIYYYLNNAFASDPSFGGESLDRWILRNSKKQVLPSYPFTGGRSKDLVVKELSIDFFNFIILIIIIIFIQCIHVHTVDKIISISLLVNID